MTRVRHTARILVLDEEGKVLLFRTHWSRRVAEPRWLTPGGGIDPGESPHQAAVRELHEETGLVVEQLGEPVWRERRPLPAGHEFDETDATYFLLRTRRFEVTDEHWMPDEHDDILDIRWFSRSDLDDPAEVFDPEDVARILDAVLGGEQRSHS